MPHLRKWSSPIAMSDTSNVLSDPVSSHEVTANTAANARHIAPAECSLRTCPLKSGPKLHAGHDDLIQTAAAGNANQAVADDFVPCGSGDDVGRNQQNQK